MAKWKRGGSGPRYESRGFVGLTRGLSKPEELKVRTFCGSALSANDVNDAVNLLTTCCFTINVPADREFIDEVTAAYHAARQVRHE